MAEQSNFVVSSIRTYVPILIASVLSYLAVHYNIVVDKQISDGFAVVLTGALISAYYGLFHILEQKWPQFGILLGKAKLPVYLDPKIANPVVHQEELPAYLTEPPTENPVTDSAVDEVLPELDPVPEANPPV